MAIEYKIPITTVSAGNIVPVTTGYYALRVSPFSTNAFAGTHVANGVWNFGAVTDGTYQLFYSADNWSTEAQVTNFGERYIASSAPTFTTAKVSTSVETDLISEKTSGSGVTIDGLLIKDGAILLDTLSEKTGGAGVTIDGVLNKDAGVTCTGASAFTGGVAITTTAITSTVTPSGANDLTNKTYVDAKVPYLYWYGQMEGGALTCTLVKVLGNLGGELSLTRTSTGIYNLNCAGLFSTYPKTMISLTTGDDNAYSLNSMIAKAVWVSSSLITILLYNEAKTLVDDGSVYIEIKVFP